MKSLASSFFVMGKMKTTEAKAKELRPYAEKMITRAKHLTLANRRYLGRFFPAPVVSKIAAYAKDAASRNGGYTRIIKAGVRKSDSARMGIIELVK